MCFMYLYIYFIYLGGKEYVESKNVFIDYFFKISFLYIYDLFYMIFKFFVFLVSLI